MNEALKHDYDKRASKKRDLTPTVMSRWYRPPEIILLDKNYG